MKFERGSGILLHITSLPSRFGIGDLGPTAYEFVDFLVRAKQKYWQVLPLGQTGYGNSPYGCYSAFAGNVYLISPANVRQAVNPLLPGAAAAEFSTGSEPRAVATGFFSSASGNPVATAPGSDPDAEPPVNTGRNDAVDYGHAIDFKLPLLKEAFETFRQTADEAIIGEFHRFCDENAFWLEDYSLYRAITLATNYKPWQEWDEALRRRDADALETARREHDDEVFAQKFYQFEFFRQWNALKSYANEKGVKIIGDVPIYVTKDSCDVWCNQDEFKLDENGDPSVVAGVPPDAFSNTGQLWGSPIYDWYKMRDGGFDWWTRRVKFNLAMFDIVRIDHFIGFTRAWQVSATEKTAKNGRWIDVPGRDLFSTLQYALGDLRLIAEDLGEVTPEVEELRDSFDVPGMRILQFAFGGDAKNTHLPHNYIQNSVAYTGTHDNDTVVGWYNARRGKKTAKPADATLKHCLEYLRTDGVDIHWEFIEAILASVADIAITPLQDVFGLNNKARMNLPASSGVNWAWRYRDGYLSDEIAAELAKLSELYGRC